MRKKLYPAQIGSDPALKQDMGTIKDLSSLALCDNIEPEARAQIEKMLSKTKEKFIREVHPFKISYLGSKNYYYTKVLTDNGTKKNITAVTEEALMEKLYAYYAEPKQSIVLEDLVKNVLEECLGVLSNKSIAEYNRLWNTFYKNSHIAKIKIPNISYDMWLDFIYDNVRKHHLTKKQAKQMMIVANRTVSYCIRRRILNHDPIRDIFKNEFPFQKEPSYNQIKAKPISPVKLEKVVEWCDKQMEKNRTMKVYPLAIKFNCRVGLRVGELRGLMWDDVDFERGSVSICRQLVQGCDADEDLNFTYSGTTIVEHLKAYEEERVLPLTEETLDILRQVKAYNLDEVMIFPMRYHTYNDKVKEAAIYAGINDLTQIRSHSLRTTAAANVYRKCHDIKVVQGFLGHTQPEMTSKYIKGLDNYESLVGLI